MPFREAIAIAVASLRSNKLRSFLTILGILIGVSSVIAVVAITEGLDRYISDKVLELGTRSFTVQKMPDVITSREMWLEMQKRKNLELSDVDAVKPSLIKYAVKLAAATRDPAGAGMPELANFLSFGVSPRGPIHLIEGARALASLRGRTYVLPQDVVDLVPDVFRHRLVLTYEALAEGMSADQIIQKIMQKIPAPEKPLETHVNVAAETTP